MENAEEIGLSRLAAAVIYEMTFCGFMDEEVKAERQKLQEAIEESEAVKKLSEEEQKKHFKSIEAVLRNLAGGISVLNIPEIGRVYMKIRLKQVIEAIEMADEAYTAFGDRQTRKPVFLDDPDITGMRNNELGALLNVEPERFYPFPTKYEIHEYGIMESFVEELPSGKARDELAGAIRGRGAFRRFKNGIRWH